MVDRTARDAAATLLRQFASRDIPFDGVDNDWPTSTSDAAIRAIGDTLARSFQDDLRPSWLPSSPESRELINRCISFLESASEYTRTVSPFHGAGVSAAVCRVIARLLGKPAPSWAVDAARFDFSERPFGDDAPAG